MTKIKKIDPKSAQSVFAFACPCLGDCATICSCTADWKVHSLMCFLIGDIVQIINRVI